MNKLTIKFYLREKTFNGIDYKIYCRLLSNREKKEFAISHRSKREDWDEAAGESLVDDTINEELDFIRNRIREIRRQMVLDNQPVRLSSVVAILRNRTGNDISLQDFLVDVLTECKKKPHYSEQTLKGYRVRMNKVLKFIKRSGQQDIKLSEVSTKFLLDFEDFLAREKHHQTGKALSRSHLNRVHKLLKQFLTQAVLRDLIPANPYRNFPPLPKEKETIKFLDSEELNKVWVAELHGNKRLERVRDFFLFTCYTGLRYSDVKSLHISQIQERKRPGGKKRLYIEKVQQKTDRSVKVPLLKEAEMIYSKYVSQEEARRTGYLFRGISNQRLNVYLKEIAALSGLDKNLTHHMARHTCATYLLSNGLRLEVVKEILGHKDIKTTLRYAKLLDNSLFDSIDRFEENLGNDDE